MTVSEICNAYESGIGYGITKDGKEPPYADPKLNEAWMIGYKAGVEIIEEKMVKRADKMKQIRVVTVQGEIEFSGIYRRDLEKKNWHYYEKSDGTLIHFRKEHMIYVEEKDT